MRRTLAALALLVLACAILASTHSADDARAATICTKHAKRVVKHVKRHGKSKKIVHFRHYWTCQEVADPVSSTTAPPSAPSTPPPAPAPAPEPEPNAVGVIARDANKHFIFEPSRTTVRSGQLTVQLINEGEDPHTMDMQRIGPGGAEGEVVEIPETVSKHQSMATVDVQPGRYRIWCTLFHHAEEGMETEITVE